MGMSGTRYQPFYDAQRDEKATREIMSRGDRPRTLNASQLALDDVPMTTVRRPVACAAWVEYGTSSVIARAFTVRWTARAVEVFWLIPNGDTHVAWVWRSAIEPRALASDEKLGRVPVVPRRDAPERRDASRGSPRRVG